MALASTSCSCVHVPGPLLLHHSSHWHGHTRGGHSVTPICTVLTAKTTVKRFWLSLLLLDRLTALQNGSWLFDRTGNQPMTVNYMHILSFDLILTNLNPARMGVTEHWGSTVTDQSPSRARMKLPDTISIEPFQQYLTEKFPEDSKHSTSSVVHLSFSKRIKDCELESTVNDCWKTLTVPGKLPHVRKWLRETKQLVIKH